MPGSHAAKHCAHHRSFSKQVIRESLQHLLLAQFSPVAAQFAGVAVVAADVVVTAGVVLTAGTVVTTSVVVTAGVLVAASVVVTAGVVGTAGVVTTDVVVTAAVVVTAVEPVSKSMQVQGVRYSGGSSWWIPGSHVAKHSPHHWSFSKQVKAESLQHLLL